MFKLADSQADHIVLLKAHAEQADALRWFFLMHFVRKSSCVAFVVNRRVK
jgi:hypothetical protein